MLGQTAEFAGIYYNASESGENKFEYRLTLNRDCSFLFHYFSYIKKMEFLLRQSRMVKESGLNQKRLLNCIQI